MDEREMNCMSHALSEIEKAMQQTARIGLLDRVRCEVSVALDMSRRQEDHLRSINENYSADVEMAAGDAYEHVLRIIEKEAG